MSNTKINIETYMNFNTIIIIESLPDTDEQTGYDLYQHLLTKKIRHTSDLKIEYHNINNKAELIQFFNFLKPHVQDKPNGIFPIIHFEVHGWSNKSGLALKNKESVSWNELGDLTRSVNFNNNLLITMSVCNGFHNITDITIFNNSPFWGIYGSEEPIFVCDLKEIFKELFDAIIDGKNIQDLTPIINKKYPSSQMKFITTDQLFFQSMKLYFDKIHKDVNYFNNRVNNLVKQQMDQDGTKTELECKKFATNYLNDKNNQKQYFIDKCKLFFGQSSQDFINNCETIFEAIYQSSKTRSL